MESTKLTTRTHTAPTCTLNVTTKAAVLPNLPQLAKPHAVDFTLHLDSPEQGESGRVTLAGNPQQLNLLQQSVSKYVAELVAKFPLQTQDSNGVEAVQHPNEPDVSAADRLYPAPGSQDIDQPNPSAPAQIETFTNLLSTKHISKLLGLSTPESRESDHQQRAKVEPAATEALHLTGGDNNLDHKLHLGNLATATSGPVLTLSAIQLFDLCATLDEYVAEIAPPKSTGILAPTPIVPTKTTTDLKIDTPAKQVDPPAADTFTPGNTPLSRLPNLPKRSTNFRENSQVYDYADTGSRSPFLSVIPWAAAAAVAVGVPLLLFGSKSNSLKDLTNNVKLPDSKAIEAAKQSMLSRLPGQEKLPSTNETDPEAKTSGVPKPWEPQAVQAPTAKSTSNIPGTQVPSSPDKIGIAPLPPAIGTQSQAPVAVAKPVAIADVAPNPLRTPSIPATMATTPGVAESSQPPVGTPITTIPVKVVKPVKITIVPKTKNSATSKFTPSKNGSIGIPPKVSVASPSPAYSTQIPFTPPTIVGDGINPTPVKPTAQKKATPPKKIATKPKKAAGSKPSPSPLMAPQPLAEPFTQSPNPNIITPIPPTSSEGSDVQNLPIIPETPVKSNIGPTSANPDPFDSPTLKETRVYFQSKWQADPNEPNPLQYVVSVNSKTGLIRSVKPQNEAATTYLKKSGLIKPGQKLVSPIATGASEQKIRVLLQPTGDVDAFIEP